MSEEEQHQMIQAKARDYIDLCKSTMWIGERKRLDKQLKPLVRVIGERACPCPNCGYTQLIGEDGIAHGFNAFVLRATTIVYRDAEPNRYLSAPSTKEKTKGRRILVLKRTEKGQPSGKVLGYVLVAPMISQEHWSGMTLEDEQK